MITTNSDDIARKVRSLIAHGSSKKYYHYSIGYNYRMTDIAAALGIEQLTKLLLFNKSRVNNASFYTTSLKDLMEITLPSGGGAGSTHVYHQYSVLVENRDEFQRFLAENGIESVVYYPVPIHKQAAYNSYGHFFFPVAEATAAKIIALPVAPHLTEHDIRTIITVVRSFFNGCQINSKDKSPAEVHFGVSRIYASSSLIPADDVHIMNKEKVELVLGRKEYQELVQLDLTSLKTERILVTGANGSIGTALIRRLEEFSIKNKPDAIDFLSTDIEGNHTYMNVTDFNNVFAVVNKYHPTVIVNIAGAKHAPEGEHETWKTLSINTIGTKNLIDCAPRDCRIILASTCKSANPEIVYGASKLIAERMTLNAGGSIARYFNVVESSGNVFEIWSRVQENEPIKVAPTCQRHFISLNEATGLILYTMITRSGRYIVNSGHLLKMGDVADRLYPHREKIIISPRRGDRLTEKFLASSEDIESYHLGTSVIKVKNIHDKV